MRRVYEVTRRKPNGDTIVELWGGAVRAAQSVARQYFHLGSRKPDVLNMRHDLLKGSTVEWVCPETLVEYTIRPRQVL